MRNYEAIKAMNVREMTGVFYSFLLPWTKACSKEQKEELWKSLEEFLMSEVRNVGSDK